MAYIIDPKDLLGWHADDQYITVEGREYHITTEPDYDHTLADDGDWYGKVEATRNNDYGHVRPRDFNGRARVIDTERGYATWWQPPDDTPEESLPGLQSTIQDLLHYGWMVLTVEDDEGNFESVGGVGAMDLDGLRECAADLITSLHNQRVIDTYCQTDLKRWMNSGKASN